jgi:hypothetical protein
MQVIHRKRVKSNEQKDSMQDTPKKRVKKEQAQRGSPWGEIYPGTIVQQEGKMMRKSGDTQMVAQIHLRIGFLKRCVYKKLLQLVRVVFHLIGKAYAQAAAQHSDFAAKSPTALWGASVHSFPGLKIGTSTPRTKTCPWGHRRMEHGTSI